MSLHVSSTCTHHQEIKIALYSIWYHHTYRWPSCAQVEWVLSQPGHETATYRCDDTQVKVKCSHYSPGVGQRVGRGTALLFHDRGTRRGWVVSSTPRPHFTPGKEPVPILREAVWAPGPVCTGGKSRPHRDSIPDRPARSQSLYRLRYPAHIMIPRCCIIKFWPPDDEHNSVRNM